MRRTERGIGLVEILIALVLGLVVVLGITQIFVSSKQSFVMQDASARMQEDARYALTRITQDIRAAGVFGCFPVASITNAPSEFGAPVSWADPVFSLVTSRPSSGNSAVTGAAWAVHTDCKTTAVVKSDGSNPASGNIAIPIDFIRYKLEGGSLKVSKGVAVSYHDLIGGVKVFEIKFGVSAGSSDTYVSSYVEAGAATPANIRSVRVRIVMDGGGKVKDQEYIVVAALRNRLL